MEDMLNKSNESFWVGTISNKDNHAYSGKLLTQWFKNAVLILALRFETLNHCKNLEPMNCMTGHLWIWRAWQKSSSALTLHFGHILKWIIARRGTLPCMHLNRRTNRPSEALSCKEVKIYNASAVWGCCILFLLTKCHIYLSNGSEKRGSSSIRLPAA